MRRLKQGEYKAVCERSGFVVPSSEIVTEWNGRKVRGKYSEPRHPGDTQRIKGEHSTPSWTRPVPENDDFQTRNVWPATSSAPTGYEQTGSFTVALTSITDDAVIRYTVNGDTPSATVGTVYSAPFAIASSLTLKAIAYLASGEVSTVSSFVYTVN